MFCLPEVAATERTRTRQRKALSRRERLSFSACVAGSCVLVLSEQEVNDGLDPMSYPLPADTNVTTPPFMDPFGNQRNGEWALDLLLPAPVSTVPEPKASWTLAGAEPQHPGVGPR